PLGENTGAVRGDSQKIGGTLLIHRQECVKKRSDQDGPAVVRLGRQRIVVGRGRAGFPLLIGFVVGPDVISQGAVVPNGLSELVGQLAQYVPVPEVASRPSDLITEGFGLSEVLEQG